MAQFKFQKAKIIGSINGEGDVFAPDCTVSLASLDSNEYTVFPGFCDVHVHFRDPGFIYKENMETGSMSAAHGGYTAVCTMPNLNPVPDSVENLKMQTDRIKSDAKIAVYPYGAITVGEKGETMADLEGMAPDCIAFSDDGKGVQDDGMMREAMTRAKALGKIIAAHCEVNDLLFGGYIHDGEYAKAHGHRGICSASEYKQIERDLKLADETGCAYHVCHISAKESVELIRQAKKSGVNVTCETGPHYLVLDDSDLIEDGRFKMNPPLRSREDKLALLEGIADGTIDMIATDHAPHSAEEKSRGLEKSAFGIVGLETALPVMNTYLVRTGIITLEKLADLMCYNPRKRFGIPMGTDFSVWALDEKFTVNPDEFRSMGRATPFAGTELYGKIKTTIYGGRIVW
ncbi:MAG: dihydroorotase [Clostridia bacterium]|nr:dihydroorotase [Clostridia bacterium]